MEQKVEATAAGAGSALTMRRAVVVVAGLNLAYGLIELAVALQISSVSLFADSIDFFEDGAVNILIAVALGWTAASRRRLGFGLALFLFLPALATLWIAVLKLFDPVAPDAAALGITALGALIINLVSALLLARHRRSGGSLAVAAWMSARNDAFANMAMIAAALVTAQVWHSAWPDLIVGLGIFYLNLDAARAILIAARAEHDPVHNQS